LLAHVAPSAALAVFAVSITNEAIAIATRARAARLDARARRASRARRARVDARARETARHDATRARRR
jgi:hypothetical protein